MSDRQAQDIEASWLSIRRQMAAAGVNQSAALNCETLKRDTNIAAIPESGRLLVFAAGGRQFWRHMLATRDANGKCLQPDSAAADLHVVDDYCLDLVKRALTEHLRDFKTAILYPGECDILLPALGEYLGWSSRSPLGLGIHHQYGLWWAYRALCWTDALIQPDVVNDLVSTHCGSCVTKPCVGACPAGAVSVTESFDLKACAEYRIASGSVCADRCLARLACPVAAEQRQDLEQHQYHQKRAIGGLRRWLSKSDE